MCCMCLDDVSFNVSFDKRQWACRAVRPYTDNSTPHVARRLIIDDATARKRTRERENKRGVQSDTSATTTQ